MATRALCPVMSVVTSAPSPWRLWAPALEFSCAMPPSVDPKALAVADRALARNCSAITTKSWSSAFVGRASRRHSLPREDPGSYKY